MRTGGFKTEEYTITIRGRHGQHTTPQTTGTSGSAYVYGDTRAEPDEYFWWEITGVTGAEMPSGDAAWGKATIVNDDIVIPTPTETLCVPAAGESGVSDKGGCLTPPWRITAENVGLSRPTSSVIVGLPLTFLSDERGVFLSAG